MNRRLIITLSLAAAWLLALAPAAVAQGRKSGVSGMLTIVGDKLILKRPGRRAVVVAYRNWDAFFLNDEPRYSLLVHENIPKRITDKLRKVLKERRLKYHEIPVR